MADEDLLARVEAAVAAHVPAATRRLAAVRTQPARSARTQALPPGLPAVVRQRLELLGITALYTHQAQAYDHVREGLSVVVATGTASGKSLCYQLPLADRLVRDEGATALYLAPTKALERDQLRALRTFRLPHLRPATYDGDTPVAERDAVRRTANVLLTNPDMLHVGILPGHRRWKRFLSGLALVVVDECHVARGVPGAHVAAVLRRLRRVASAHGASPTFVLASATIANPAEHASRLTGLDVTAVVDDGSPRAATTYALWEPPLLDVVTGSRRPTLAEAAEVLAALAAAGCATLAFVRSRRGAEIVAASARRRLADVGLADAVMAYRAGYLPEERRAVERALVAGELRAVAATDALELGVDVGGLDAVVTAGWPGTAASLHQQAGRAGRRGRDAVAVFVAADDPLDHYLLAYPEALFDRPVEAALVDVANPYVLRPHLRCAAAEVPLSADEPALADLPPGVLSEAVAAEVADGGLRERAGRWWAEPAGRGGHAATFGLRGAGGPPVSIVEAQTGTLIGDADEHRAHRTLHEGAVYLHQGQAWRIARLDLDAGVAEAVRDAGDERTWARTDAEITVLREDDATRWGDCRIARGRVEVTTQVLAYERRVAATDVPVEVVPLDLPPLRLVTAATWLVVPDEVLAAAGLVGDGDAGRVPGSVHAAEHAAIGLLPLFAMCDRWDLGGVSTPWHPDTGAATIFVYDAHAGGAGITERGYALGRRLWTATRDTIAACSCDAGCPSCVQSPKCGNGNHPLDKRGAVLLLDAALA